MKKKKLFLASLIPLIMSSCYQQEQPQTKEEELQTTENKATAPTAKQLEENTAGPAEDATPMKSHPIVFDNKTKKFYEKQDGIAEEVLNKHNLTDLDTDQQEIYRLIDSIEMNNKFIEVDEYKGGMNRLETLMNIVQAFKTLDGVDSLGVDELKEEYVPLKKLMQSIEPIYYDKNKTDLEKMEEIYLKISETIKPDYSKERITTIEDMVAGKAGECSDVVAAYYSTMTYYHQPVGFRIGGVKGEGETGLHMWLVMKIDDEWQDFDPTWYQGYFVPLEQRKKENDDVSGVKDKFVRQTDSFEYLIEQREKNKITRLKKNIKNIQTPNQYSSL